jgi:excisionase family DNA binding protein
MTKPQLLHIGEAAEELGLSQWQTHALVDQGRLRAEKLKNRTYITRASIDEFVNKFGQAS